jgi:hypothetical protein
MGYILAKQVAGDVTFSHYRKGNLWYVTSRGLEFPVPIEDTGDAEFKTVDKGLYFMRWIRKHIESIEQAKTEQEQEVITS